MGRHRNAVLGAATIVAALGLSGCSADQQGASPETEPPLRSESPSSAAAGQLAPLPSAAALAGVLYRLADPAVPGTQKLNLVEGAAPENAAVLDQFAAALLNGGFAPVNVDVRDIAWSDRDPGDAVAIVNISSPNRRAGRFSFPMEFKPYRGGWQLSARTADILLAFGTTQVAPPITPGH
jgi:hypothetical protein